MGFKFKFFAYVVFVALMVVVQRSMIAYIDDIAAPSGKGAKPLLPAPVPSCPATFLLILYYYVMCIIFWNHPSRVFALKRLHPSRSPQLSEVVLYGELLGSLPFSDVEGMAIVLDGKFFGYSCDQAANLLSSLTPAQRLATRAMYTTYDFVFPFAYGLVHAWPIIATRGLRSKLIWFTLVTIVFDFCENYLVLIPFSTLSIPYSLLSASSFVV